jgi:hypothetical protein
MVLVTETAKMDWQEKPTPREGRIQRKPLAKGAPGAPNNFEFNLYRFHTDYTTPRHRHNFEQMRFGVKGLITYVPKKLIEPGTLVFFPEGAYYGPQETPETADILLLQYGGASGQGYLSQEQLFQAKAEMSKTGTFSEGVYTVVTDDGRKVNQDAVEACYEHVFHKKVDYSRPRIPEPIEIVSEAHSFVKTDIEGLWKKTLGVFTEREVSARIYEARAGTELPSDSSRRRLVFSLQGQMHLDGKTLEPLTSLYADQGEEMKLKLDTGWQGLMIELPRW